MASQPRRALANTATCGISACELSSVPTQTVIRPGMPVFIPNSGLPQARRSRRYPASLSASPAFQSKSSCKTCNALPRSDVSSGSRATIRRASSPATAMRSRWTKGSAKT